ncbi:insulin-degrading enzyme-like [Temnothorax longispinosus]|uniref:insulin-degrading enzyme-like n=1 Tax=Temnothorax longispinosus TaxID=300112 RepID=UPI003A99120B
MSPCVTVKNPYVKAQFDNIKRAHNDHKSYRGLVLENKMKILLISDPTTDISIAAMDVNIGYNCDTRPLHGLAHLCEHMLHRGSEKYRAPDDFEKYVSQFGGKRNSETRSNCTSYYFNIHPDNLDEGLDKFAQFFIAPLFDETLIEKEINAIDLEYKEKLEKDEFRFMGLEKLSIKPDHPYSKFGMGNKETLDATPKKLGINVRTELKKFYDNYYSAHIMSLCILGKGMAII